MTLTKDADAKQEMFELIKRRAEITVKFFFLFKTNE